eukprot:jgi/Botrbrau1/16230/Bobra.0066s0016.1
MVRRAPSGQGTGSLTQRLRKFDFKVQGKSVNFTVWDTPGWTKNDYRDGSLNLIMNGSLRDRVDLSKGLPQWELPPIHRKGKRRVVSSFYENADIREAVHVMALVVPCDAVSDEEYFSKLLEIKEFARVRDMPVIIFMTKVDEYEPGLVGNLSDVFHSQKILNIMQVAVINVDVVDALELSLKAGVPRNCIVPVKNFCTEFEPELTASILVLRGIYEALNCAKDYLREVGDSDGLESEDDYEDHEVWFAIRKQILNVYDMSYDRHGFSMPCQFANAVIVSSPVGWADNSARRLVRLPQLVVQSQF